MEIRELKTLIAISEEGSFLKAGERLGYNQSSITAQMNKLEEDLQMKLFEKVGRKMILTNHGRAVLEKAYKMVDLSKSIYELAQDKNNITGVLKVNIANSLLTYQMQKVLVEFRKIAPNVKLILKTSTSNNILKDLKTRNCDLGIDYDSALYKNDFSKDYLRKYYLVLIGSSNISDKLNLKEIIENNCFIIDEPDSIFRIIFEEYLIKQGLDIGDVLELWSLESIKRCVESNLGISFLPRFTCERELKDNTIKIIDFPINNFEINAICLRHKDHYETPAMKLFTQLCKNYLEE